MDLPFETHAERSTGLRESFGRIIEKLGGDWLVWGLSGSAPDVLALMQYRDEDAQVPYDRRRTTLGAGKNGPSSLSATPGAASA